MAWEEVVLKKEDDMSFPKKEHQDGPMGSYYKIRNNIYTKDERDKIVGALGGNIKAERVVMSKGAFEALRGMYDSKRAKRNKGLRLS